MIAFFAEFDPVEYADFDFNELALDDSQPRLLLVVFPRVFIIIVPRDNDDDVHDDEERFLPPNLELVNVFSRKRTPTTSDDDDDDALVRVVQYKSIVVVTENAREKCICVSRFFPKRAALLEEMSDPKSFTKTHHSNNTLRAFYSEKSSPNDTFANEEEDNNNNNNDKKKRFSMLSSFFSGGQGDREKEHKMLFRAILAVSVLVTFATVSLYDADALGEGIFAESSAKHHVNTMKASGTLKSLDGFKHEYLDPGHDHSPVGTFEAEYREKLETMGYTKEQIAHFERMSAETLVHLFQEATEVIDRELQKSRGTAEPMHLPGLSEWLERKREDHVKNKKAREEKEKEKEEERERRMERAREENGREEEEMEEKYGGDGGKMMSGEEVMAAIEAHDIAWKKAHPPPSPPVGSSSSSSSSRGSSSSSSSSGGGWISNNLFGHFGKKKSEEVGSEERGDGEGEGNDDEKVETDSGSSSSGGGDDDDESSTDNADDPPVFKSMEERKAFLKTDQFKKLAADLTPPKFCHEAVNGEKAFPTNGKITKGAPSVAAAAKIAEQLTDERECWFMDKTCVDALSPGNGKQWIRKYMSAETTVTDILEDLPDFGKGQLGTCALIGSADNMLKKGWGTQIDAHDFVVRFNSKMKGFEKDIGYKTDGLWQKDSYVGAIGGNQKPSKYYMIPKIIPKNFVRKDGARVVGYSTALPSWRKAITEIYKIYKKDKKITKGTPTGGLARMISLMESGACTRVDIYGFSGGGGKYFKKSAVVKDEHIISVEHYIRRLMMATGLRGKVCVYGQ